MSQPFVTHLLYTIQDSYSSAWQSSSETVFTLFSLFFGGPCLSITDQDCGRDFMGEADSNLSQPFGTYLLYTIQNPYSSAWQSSSETVFTLFSLFFGGPCLSITDQDCGRDFMGEADSNLSQPFGTYLLYTIQNPYSSAWQSSSETVFTLFSLFFGGPCLSSLDQDWGRDFVGKADSILGLLLFTHLLSTV